MNITELTYPLFEANQVLTPGQLNDLVEYLDEQQRLTRANLIGIGVACGLEVGFDSSAATISLSKGVGVTSEGYLIVEPADVTLAHRRPYTLPKEYGYPPFLVPGSKPPEQFDVWELLETSGPGTTSLDDVPEAELAAQAVVLFLELRKDGLRNCSPNSCDDLGAQITGTVRRLLIGRDDLVRMIEDARDPDLPAQADLASRMGLPDLRMPRFDVPNTSPVTSEEVLRGFQQVLRPNRAMADRGLVTRTAAALRAVYLAFHPLIVDDFPTDPFDDFAGEYEFLEGTQLSVAQIRNLPYYWDLFDDLIAAYDELRWKGVNLLCACCPSDRPFPRHLMAGALDVTADGATRFRHRWLPSPAVGDCEDRTREVRMLFQRLVTMVRSFIREPTGDLRITPSRLGPVALSAKAIPFYYAQSGQPRLHEVWSPEQTARGRAHHNLGYRWREYAQPAPSFVAEPLRFDLEPSNFLRIEGHLGRSVWTVLEDLLAMRRAHRLPFQVLALRTGAFDESHEIDLTREECRFRDLEALFDTLRSELFCFLSKEVQHLYDYSLPYTSPATEPSPPRLPFLREQAPEFLVKPGTLGRWLEDGLRSDPRLSLRIPDQGVWPVAVPLGRLVTALAALGGTVGDDIRHLEMAEVGQRYRELDGVATAIRERGRDGTVAEFAAPELAGRLDDILFRCRLAPFQALAEEYRRRVRDARREQYLGHFLERHPGIQHKAGVPLGGTFILVYHELARPEPAPAPVLGVRPPFRPVELGEPLAGAFPDLGGRPIPRPIVDPALRLIDDTLARLPFKRQLALDPDVQALYRALTGNLLTLREPVASGAGQVYRDAVRDLPDGAVIADFFLPYPCGTDCGGTVYQLPGTRLRLTTTLGGTDAQGQAEVTLAVQGAEGAVSVQVDGGPFQESTGRLLLGIGDHRLVVQDAAGRTSDPVTVTVPPTLGLGVAQAIVDDATGTYQVVVGVDGGVPPYRPIRLREPVDTTDADAVGTIVGSTYTSPPVRLGEGVSWVIQDGNGCTVEGSHQTDAKPCELPCEGRAIRAGYRFWLPQPVSGAPINAYRFTVNTFTVTDPNGVAIDLSADVQGISIPTSINASGFDKEVTRWLERVNDHIATSLSSSEWLQLAYEAPQRTAFGTLYIDRLACIDLTFELNASFVVSGSESQVSYAYDSAGTHVRDLVLDSAADIPLFDISISNKCRPDDPPLSRCLTTDLAVAIAYKPLEPGRIYFMAEGSGSEPISHYLWEFQDGTPALAGEPEVDVQFSSERPREKLIRLTVFTATGCVSSDERTINVFEPGG